MNLLWPMDPPVTEQRCLAYQYTQFGKWTYFGQWTSHTRAEMPWLLVHRTWQMNILWPMDPWYHSWDALNTSTQYLADEPTLASGTPWCRSRDALHTSTHNLADEPTLANGSPWYQSRDALHSHTQYLADEPTLVNGSPVRQQRCLEYQYTILGRWTYFSQWTLQYLSRDALHTSIHNLADEPTLANWPPWYQSRDALHTHTQNMADESTLANGPSNTTAEMPCIPVHNTWQMKLLWPMDPLVPQQRCLDYQYTKLGRWTYFGRWIPQYQSRDALNISTQYLADEPTLANEPPK